MHFTLPFKLCAGLWTTGELALWLDMKSHMALTIKVKQDRWQFLDWYCSIPNYDGLMLDFHFVPGRQYDREGNMRQWWNNDTITEFRKRAQCIIDQYNTYTLQPFGYKVSQINTWKRGLIYGIGFDTHLIFRTCNTHPSWTFNCTHFVSFIEQEGVHFKVWSMFNMDSLNSVLISFECMFKYSLQTIETHIYC